MQSYKEEGNSNLHFHYHMQSCHQRKPEEKKGKDHAIEIIFTW